MKLYITRHSKTLWNDEKRLQGWQDSPLTTQGKQDAQELKRYLENINIDYVYSSPIGRALNTSELVFDQQIFVDDRLKEMNFGNYEGRYIADLLNDSDYDILWNHPYPEFKLDGGETYQEVYNRLDDFMNDIYLKHQNDILFLTIHGMLFTVLMVMMKKMTIEELPNVNKSIVQGCSLTEVDYDGINFDIKYIGKNDYLSHQENISYNKK